MTITIRHPGVNTRRIRNTMIAAVVAVLVGVASYGIVETVRDNGSGPASLIEPTSPALVQEHGEFTQPFVRDTSQQNYSGFVGSNPPNLDPDVLVEHGEFTKPFVRDTSQQNYSGFVGSNPPNLDPDIPVP